MGYFGVVVVVDSVGVLHEVQSQAKLVILFNPWNPDDDVYISGIFKLITIYFGIFNRLRLLDDRSREEYVENEDGLAWGGSETYRVPMPWQHNHFSQTALEVSLRFLDYLPSFEDRKVFHHGKASRESLCQI